MSDTYTTADCTREWLAEHHCVGYQILEILILVPSPWQGSKVKRTNQICLVMDITLDFLSLYMSPMSALMLSNALAISDHAQGLLPLVLGPPAADFCLSLPWCQNFRSCPRQTSWWVGWSWGPDLPSYTLWVSHSPYQRYLYSLAIPGGEAHKYLPIGEFVSLLHYLTAPPNTWRLMLVRLQNLENWYCSVTKEFLMG